MNFKLTPDNSKFTLPLMDVKNMWKHYLVPCCEMVPVRDLTKTVLEGADCPTIGIVGAGMAGLSAAVRLRNAGINNIIILESKCRPGGRIHSLKKGKLLLEFGGDQIEGACLANPIYNLACMSCPLQRPTVKRQKYYVTPDGHTYLEKKEAEWLLKGLLTEATGYFTRAEDGKDISLYEFLKQRIMETTHSLNSKERNIYLTALAGMLNRLRGRIGEDLDVISLRNYGSYIDIPGSRTCIPRGAISLIKNLISELGDNSMIRYNKTVQNIRYSVRAIDAPRAVIVCCDGDEFPVDYVICTVSLGVLKSTYNVMFSPPLPYEKLNAISSIGFGQITRIFLQYSKPFWSKGERTTLNLSWNLENKAERGDWMRGITLIEELPGKECFLRVTVAGKEAAWVEETPLTMVAEQLTEFLRSITGDWSLPCPKDVIMTKWNTDLSFMGCKSYLGIGSSIHYQCHLAAPLPGASVEGPPIILFAGEATSPGHYGTMHGARISGVREADRIIDLTIALKGCPKNAIIEEEQPRLVPCPIEEECIDCLPPPPAPVPEPECEVTCTCTCKKPVCPKKPRCT